MKHVVSVSGGKDSTATYLRCLELGFPFRAVAADTGNEHPATYEAIADLSRITGGPEVELVRADFSDQIIARRAYVAEKWPADLMSGTPGRWDWREDRPAMMERRARLRAWIEGGRKGAKPKPLPPESIHAPPIPDDPFLRGSPARYVEGGAWIWKPGRRPMTEEEAQQVIEVALAWLHPTGNPFLDLCILKGRFPSRKAQFCTSGLKVEPINRFVTTPLLRAGETVISWQGVRRAESIVRASYTRLQRLNFEAHDGLPVSGRLYAFRPLLDWTTEEVFAYADRFGVPRNPLYAMGCGRVGCFPCINAQKSELALVDRVFPEQIDRLEEWEERVSKTSKRGQTTFFNFVNDPVMSEQLGWAEQTGDVLDVRPETHGIRAMVQWAKTDRGGRQFSLFAPENEVCSTAGMCE